MKYSLVCANLAVSLLALTAGASAREVVLPAGTLLQCTLNEPNFSSATAEVGDPVLCHLRGITQFGQEAFPRGSYLVGHLESAKDPGHFVGKGYLQLEFDRIGLPSGDVPLSTKVIATRGYKVDKEGKIDGKGHAKRDVVEWMLPPLWPWKVVSLPARGPRPKLKGETVLSLRLMDDVQVPQLTAAVQPRSGDFYTRPQRQSYYPQSGSVDSGTHIRIHSRVEISGTNISTTAAEIPRPSYISLSSPVAQTAVPALSPGSPVFILKTGTMLTVGNYQYQDGRITYTLASGGGGVVFADDVDWTTTTRVNNQRGVRVTLHGGRMSTETPGL